MPLADVPRRDAASQGHPLPHPRGASHGDATMSSGAASNITSILRETRLFPPPPEFAARALIGSVAEYERLWLRAKDDPRGFWAEQAESLHWFRRWDEVLVWNEPHAQWFVGGQ